MGLTKILQDAQDPDDIIRSAAEGDLRKLQELDFPNFLLSLSAELSKDASPPDCRRLAGIILKNSVEGKYSQDNLQNINRWINLDQHIKSKIKESLLKTLGSSDTEARHASSQIIGRLAYIEIPRDWQGLIGTLLGNMAQEDVSPTLKQASLEALGYVFEEFLMFKEDEIEDVLDAVLRAMNQTEPSSEVRLAAVKALQNVVMFANFANEDCRNRIMTAICDAAKSDEAETVRHAAFGCLTALAPERYMALEPFMETILGLTAEALEGGVETVVL